MASNWAMRYRLCVATLITGIAAFSVTTARASTLPTGKQLSLIFTVKSSGPISGAFPAMLTYDKGTLSGSITTVGFACTVAAGSTDITKKLNLTCSVLSGLSTDTYIGTLGVVDGRGKGKFTDSFYSETGTYTVAPATE